MASTNCPEIDTKCDQLKTIYDDDAVTTALLIYVIENTST